MTSDRPASRIKLGDAEVSRIGLGTNRLTNTPEHVEFVRAAVAAGLTHLDTAHTYTGGESESTIGAALSPRPDDVVVATKGGYAPGTGRPEELRSQIDESLRRLRTDRIDLYYLHRVHPATPFEDSLGALREAREAGKIRDVGLSQVGIDQIEQARRIVPIAAAQNHYNLSERGWDDSVDHCARVGIVFVPYFPLQGAGSTTLDDIARRHGVTPAQIRLAWLLRRSPVTLPIPGTLSLAHLKENLAALDVELTDEEYDALL
jgi:aryl-alcohol dehydrogenase-like predicted oxidoreductase